MEAHAPAVATNTAYIHSTLTADTHSIMAAAACQYPLSIHTKYISSPLFIPSEYCGEYGA